MRQPFSEQPLEVRRFYVALINSMLLNMVAVQRGYFDTLISTVDDFYDITAWYNAVPEVLAKIAEENESRKNGS